MPSRPSEPDPGDFKERGHGSGATKPKITKNRWLNHPQSGAIAPKFPGSGVQSRGMMPSSSKGELPVETGSEPGPYAPASSGQTVIITQVVERLVKQKVASEIERQQQSLVQQQPGPPDKSLVAPQVADLVTDEVARHLLQRMQILSQEEQFRAGQL